MLVYALHSPPGAPQASRSGHAALCEHSSVPRIAVVPAPNLRCGVERRTRHVDWRPTWAGLLGTPKTKHGLIKNDARDGAVRTNRYER